MSRCRGCSAAYYCNRECQRNHWKIHKSKCESIKKLAATDEKEQQDSLRILNCLVTSLTDFATFSGDWLVPSLWLANLSYTWWLENHSFLLIRCHSDIQPQTDQITTLLVQLIRCLQMMQSKERVQFLQVGACVKWSDMKNSSIKVESVPLGKKSLFPDEILLYLQRVPHEEAKELCTAESYLTKELIPWILAGATLSNGRLQSTCVCSYEIKDLTKMFETFLLSLKK